MTTSGLASPLPAVRPRDVRAEQAPLPAPSLFQPRDKIPFLRRYGRALVFSVLVHLLLFVLSPYVVVINVEGGGGADQAPGGVVQTTYVEIALSPPSDIVPLSQVSTALPPVTAAAVVTTGGVRIPVTAGTGVLAPGAQPSFGGAAGGAGAVGGIAPTPGSGAGAAAGAGGGAGAAAAALRPGYRDSRLYIEGPLIPDLDKTAEQRYAEHLSARMEAVRDSIVAEASRADMTPDWVHTDGSGNRWGLSDQGLHLGGITIPRQLVPIPRPTGDNQSQQDARERQRQRDEIQRQEQERERRAILEERNRAAQDARENGR